MFSISNLSRKEKIGIYISLFVIGLAFFDRLIISPISGKYRQLNHEIRISGMQLYRDLCNVHQQEDIISDFQKYKQYVKSTGSDEEVTAEMLAAIEETAHNSGIDLIDVKPQDARQEDIYKDYAIEVEAGGEMKSLVAFLYQLNNSKQLLRVVKVHLNPKDKESSMIRASLLVTKIVIP